MKNVLFLTSYLDLYDKDEHGNKIAKNFGNRNDILTNLKKYIGKYDNFLFVASDEYNIENTDVYASATIKSFEKTLPFKNYKILDIRTEENAQELIGNADLIFLCGGHLPTQNEFFNKIKLKELLEDTNAVIVGGSAGSMNCANNVYCPPELLGESMDKYFKRELIGLALTDISIIPHYNIFKDYILDEKRYMEDIIFPDSFDRDIYVLCDGSYIMIDNDIKMYGESYLLSNGVLTKICDDNKNLIINNNIKS